MNTATSETVIETIVKPDLGRAVERRLQRRLAHVQVADDVLQHHDRVVHDEADRQRQGQQRQVVERVAEQVHDPERGDDRHRQREARDDRRPDVPEEQEDHQHDQDERDEQRDLHVVDRLLDRRRSGRTGRRAGPTGGSWAWRVGSSALTCGRHLDRVRPRLPLHAEDDGPGHLARRRRPGSAR